MAERIFRGLRKKPDSPNDPYDRVIAWCLWLVVFLVPIFNLPWSTDPLELNKALLFYILILIAGITWFLKAILKRTARWFRSPYDYPVAAFVLLSLLATIFSVSHYRSLVGTSGYVGNALLSVVFFALFFQLIVQTVRREQLAYYFSAVLLSGAIVVIFNFLQVFSVPVFPWEFTKVVTFNATTGSPLVFTVYLAVLGLLSFYKVLANKRQILRILLAFLSLLCFFIIAVYDQPIAWYAVIIGLVILMVFLNAAAKEMKPLWLLLPTVLIGLSLLGLLINTQRLLRASIPGDVILPAKVGWQTTLSTMRHRPLLGSGPETFDVDFAKYRPQSYNDTALWNIRFLKSSNEWFQLAATIGVLGVLAYAVLIALFLWSSAKDLIRASWSDPHWWYRLGVMTGGVLLAGLLFFTPSNFFLAFLLWMFLGFSVVLQRKQEPSILEENDAPKTMAFIPSIGFSVAVIAGIVLMYFLGRFWWADVQVAQAQDLVRRTQSLDTVRGKLASSISLNSYEPSTYFSLAQNLVVQAQLAAQADKPDLTQIQTYLTAAAASAKTGADHYYAYAGSHEASADVYRSIDNFSGQASQAQHDALQGAIDREPTNPQLFLKLGQYYLAVAQQQQAAATAKDTAAALPDDAKASVKSAKEAFTKAASLKTNYVEARLNIALSLRLEGNAKDAVAMLEQIAKDNPNNTDALFNLAENYRLDGRDDEAAVYFQRITSLFPGNSDAHFRLAEYYEKKDKIDLAIAELEVVKKLNPSNTDVQKKLEELRKK